jgi:hypothetical protein
LRDAKQFVVIGRRQSDDPSAEAPFQTKASNPGNAERSIASDGEKLMSGKEPTAFAFDFTHAGRVSWNYGSRNGEFQQTGTPAGFFVDDSEIADQFSQVLEPLSADLVDIAVAVHMADRLALRDIELNNQWSRRLGVKISVRHPEVWQDATLKGRIESLLTFLTEDLWSLEFVARRDALRSSETQAHLFPSVHNGKVEVSLFSGGLDSFAGTAAAVNDCEGSTFVLFSASPNPRQRYGQQQQVKLLRQELGRQIFHICVPYGMHSGDEYAQESSRRTRGFLFLVLGGVTALSARVSALRIYENGVGAMNLPYDRSQVGADNARAVHPRVLRETAELLSLVGSRQFSISNGCIFKTKAEMLRHPVVARLSNAISLTFSCDGFPVRAKGHAQCGFCTSCLLRRLSLESAGLENHDSNGYLQDWRLGTFKPTKHHLRGLRAMDWQVLRLRKCFAEAGQWRALTAEFPELRILANELSHIEAAGGVETKLLEVLKQHSQEWQSFSAVKLLSTKRIEAA